MSYEFMRGGFRVMGYVLLAIFIIKSLMGNNMKSGFWDINPERCTRNHELMDL